MGFFSAVKKLFGAKDAPKPAAAPAAPAEPENTAPTIGQEDALIATPEAAAFPPPEAPMSKKKLIPEQATAAQPAAEKPASSGETAAPAAEKSEFSANAATPAAESASALAGQADSAATQSAESTASAAPAAEKAAPIKQAAAPAADPAVLSDSAAATAAEPPTAQAQSSGEDADLLARLRAAEPRLSAWLAITLEGQDEANAEFWRRLRFFLEALEAPEAEISAFLADFQRWLEAMDYNHVDEFRSELQYRLALALDLEDEEDERNRLLLKLSQGLAATRKQLGRQLDSLFASHGELDAAFWEQMEEIFIMADIGYDASMEIVARLKRRAADAKAQTAEAAKELLQDELEEIFREQPKIKAAAKPEVILMMGVNGAGKTTTIAKLAHRSRMEGKKVLIAAADTFRAAAIEQLEVWATRAGAEFYARPSGSDPASVAWGAMDYALANDIDVVYVDTAGRLQTRVNLMEELGKIRQVLGKKHPGAPHRNILVLDATTGQNALSQAKLFREGGGADEIILTKLDGTAKGGVAIGIALQEKLPITFIGLGEKMEDLRPFSGRDFASALLMDKAA